MGLKTVSNVAGALAALMPLLLMLLSGSAQALSVGTYYGDYDTATKQAGHPATSLRGPTTGPIVSAIRAQPMPGRATHCTEGC